MNNVLATDLGAGLIEAGFGALVTVFTAAVVGTRLSYRWDEMRRLRESDHAARESFYAAYALFFSTWKRWETAKGRYTISQDLPSKWDILSASIEAEGHFEALLVKLASERDLSPEQCKLLACFRQSYQALRERIRVDKSLDWWSRGGSGPERQAYWAFKALAEHFGYLLAEDRRPPSIWKPSVHSETSLAQRIANLEACTQDVRNWVSVAEQQLGLGRSSGARPAELGSSRLPKGQH